MSHTVQAAAVRAAIERTIRSVLADPDWNSLGPDFPAPAWDAPLLGVSSGADPLYPELKRAVGPFHWTPSEAFAACSTGGRAAADDELSVVSWVLPQTPATKESNRLRHRFPSEAWARARIYGQACNRVLHERLVEALAAIDVAAVAPSFLPCWHEDVRDGVPVASSWSERHVAYISGLGTFGLCDGLITAAGKAVRLGSVVVCARLEPTPRAYTDLHEYCLFFSRGSCGRCAARCPVGSVMPAGRDKAACHDHLESTKTFVRQAYGFDGYGCGLCQTGVPCESRIPTIAGKTAKMK